MGRKYSLGKIGIDEVFVEYFIDGKSVSEDDFIEASKENSDVVEQAVKYEPKPVIVDGKKLHVVTTKERVKPRF